VRDGAEVSLRRPTLSQERKRKKKSACSVRNDGVAGAERKEWRDQVAAEGDERRKYHRPDPSAALRRETAATGRKWRHEVAATGKIAGLKTGHYKWRRGKAGAGLLHSKNGKKLQDWENGSVAGEMARVYIGGGLQGHPEESQPKSKWRCGDEEYALVSIGGVFGGGIADARGGDGAESV